VTQPRIAVFARSANGNLNPTRSIGGQRSKLTRTVHGMAMDSVHDELFVPVPMAASILVFRGQADGDEPPIRVIQGPKTSLVFPFALAFDPVHDELIVTDGKGGTVFSFARTANGDVAPLRAIRGPKTRLGYMGGPAVDTKRDLLLVWSADPERTDKGAIFVFNRLDDGNVEPRAIIAGPNAGMGRPFNLAVVGDNIVATIFRNNYNSPYNQTQPRSEEFHRKVIAERVAAGAMPPKPVSQDPTVISLPSAFDSSDPGFIGVWRISDNGNIAPRFMVRGPSTGIVVPAALTIAPEHKEVIVADGASNSVLSFFLPEIFDNPTSKAASPAVKEESRSR